MDEMAVRIMAYKVIYRSFDNVLTESFMLFATRKEAERHEAETSSDVEESWVEECDLPTTYLVCWGRSPLRCQEFATPKEALAFQISKEGSVYYDAYRRPVRTAADEVRELSAKGGAFFVAVGDEDGHGGFEDAWDGSCRPHTAEEMLAAIASHEAYFANIFPAKDFGWQCK